MCPVSIPLVVNSNAARTEMLVPLSKTFVSALSPLPLMAMDSDSLKLKELFRNRANCFYIYKRTRDIRLVVEGVD